MVDWNILVVLALVLDSIRGDYLTQTTSEAFLGVRDEKESSQAKQQIQTDLV